MKKKDYQMTTVAKYVELLDSEMDEKNNKIRIAAEQYLLQMRKSKRNAENAGLLELLLA